MQNLKKRLSIIAEDELSETINTRKLVLEGLEYGTMNYDTNKIQKLDIKEVEELNIEIDFINEQYKTSISNLDMSILKEQECESITHCTKRDLEDDSE
ncbi:2553_t:CDS:2 [Gigaspora margarita]|uniref:2553_t:CDS:1 n=1 Tax=Gigaspora margarita TaxID=4874 RepID=A0ABM8W160_GIGMA|nr:2553_t:CDS:2 [Gigaspora margarita]